MGYECMHTQQLSNHTKGDPMSLMCMLLYKFLVIGYVTTFIQTNNHNTTKQENPSKDPHYTVKRLHLLVFQTLLLAKGYLRYPFCTLYDFCGYNHSICQKLAQYPRRLGERSQRIEKK